MGDFLGEFFTADKIFKGLGIDKICDIPEVLPRIARSA